jgi:hypothetical protein
MSHAQLLEEKKDKINKNVIAKGTIDILAYIIVTIDIIIQCTTSDLPLLWQRCLKAAGDFQKLSITFLEYILC